MDPLTGESSVLPWLTNKKFLLGVFAALVLGGIIFLLTSWLALFSLPPGGGVFALVPDSISQSAPIPIHLPAAIAVAQAKGAISFEPRIDGAWMEVKGTPDTLLFLPNKKLDIGKHYTVALSLSTVHLKKDVLVDEDPRVASIFPGPNSEASETSAITIMFNRPMVPLTTLDMLDSKDVPVTIAPRTQGTFHWISTRSLQFVPQPRLKRSSTYTVSVKARAFISVDGLAVPGFTHTFTTRPVRYEYASQGQTLYAQPIRVIFNQPVDLEKTKAALSLVQTDTQKKVSFIANYGSHQVYNKKTKKQESFTDKSIIEIYNARDAHNRQGLWDFAKSYRYRLAQAYPLEGDSILKESKEQTITVPEVIKSLSAQSERSKYVEADVFDPQGTLAVHFFEDIDKAKTRINAQNLKAVDYDQICKVDENGQKIMIGEECQKETDKKTLLLTFDPEGLAISQKISVRFENIVNRAGFVLNPQPLVKIITVYPALKVFSFAPFSGSQNASLTELIVCTSTPLTPANEGTFSKRLQSNITVGLWNWDEPYRVDKIGSSPCKPGQFKNQVQYGLLPESRYTITLRVVDDFNQTATTNVSFVTAKLADKVRAFFNLEKGYNVTSPDKTKFTYAVENLEYVNLSLCQVDAPTMLKYVRDFPSETDAPNSFGCLTTIQKVVELPKRYWTRNYFQINVKDYIPNPLGHYIISFGHPDYRSPNGKQIYERTLVTITRLAVAQKEVAWEGDENDPSPAITKAALTTAPQNLYWVSEFGTLNPVGSATVEVYQEPLKRVGSYATNEQGVIKTPAVPKLIGAVVSKGNDSTLVMADKDNIQWASLAGSAQLTYLYTDRPMYRPGQEVFIKGLHRVGYDGNYEILKGKKAELEIFNAKDESISKQSVEINDYGTFTASLILDAQASLGTYRIHALDGDAFFDVEEYTPSAFKLEVASNKEEYIASDTIALDINANYYFGVPLSEGQVEYSVVSQDYYFDRFSDQYFSFGNDWYYSSYTSYGDKFLRKGRTTLDSLGKARIEQPLDFAKFFKGDEANKSKILVFNITVKNSNGQSVSTQKSLIVHRGEFYLGVALNNSFLAKGEQFLARFKSVDTQGKERSVSNIKVNINKITWDYFKRQEVDGGDYYQSQIKKELVNSFSVSTDEKGNATKELRMNQEGEFEITLQATDGKGNVVSTAQSLYVYGSGQASIRPTNNETLDLATDKAQVKVGESIPIIIKSPYPRAKALISIERGKIFSYEIVDVTGSFYEYTFWVKEEYVPNIYVSVLLLGPRPEIKYGQINYRVNAQRKTITIKAKPNKTHYLPGETVSLDIAATDWQGKPLAAELSLAVADLSVLALKGNPKKNPLVFFYGDLPLTVTTASNIKNILYEADIPLGTKGGGGEPQDLAKKRRGIFKDTALWQGVVRTDALGHARLSFTLPDNLTTWQIESVGITQDTKVGVGYQEFITRKEIMVVPLRPRFVLPGDTFLVGANVFNQTDSAQSVEVSLAAPTLTTSHDTSQSVRLASKESQTVYFQVQAPPNIQEGKHVITISAKNKQYDDTVVSEIPITRNDTYEAIATGNYTTAATTKEYIYLPDTIIRDKGGITIKTSATLAVFLSDALNSLVSYPYGCSEQIASKLASLAILKRGLAIKNISDAFTLKNVTFEGQEYSLDDVVRIGLARIYENQQSDGGFSYYASLPPDAYLTLHIIEALQELKQAGYSINDAALAKAANFLSQKLTQDPSFVSNADFVILGAYTLSLLPQFTQSNEQLTSRVTSIASNAAFINESISNESLAYLALLLTQKTYPVALKNSIFSVLENRISIDGRGAFLAPYTQHYLAQYYETPIKDTALLLKALSADHRQHPLLDRIVRWLLQSRFKDGAWGSTNNTVTVISALSDFLTWKKETESQFNLAIQLGSTPIGSAAITSDTILKTFIDQVDIKNIPLHSLQTLLFSKTNRNNAINAFYYDVVLKYFLPIDKIPPRDEGFGVSQAFYNLDDKDMAAPLVKANVGDVVRGRLTISVPKHRDFTMIESYIPAGMEIVNLHLATEDQSLQTNPDSYGSNESMGITNRQNNWFANLLGFSNPFVARPDLPDDAYSPKEAFAMTFYPDAQESHTDRLALFKERLEPGVYTFDYYARALIPGTYHLLPTVASELYFPENFGRSAGKYFEVIKSD